MKTAVVTGASYGLGSSIVEILLFEGYKVYGISRTKPKIENPNFVWVRLDLLNKSGLENIKYKILEKRIDLLVNNAGTAFIKPALEFVDENFNEMFALNFKIPIKMTSLLLPKIKNGLVINTSSNSDRFAGVGYGLYCASKAALNIYFDAVGMENESLKIFNILPSYIDTPLQHKLNRNNKDFNWEITMDPDEVAGSVYYLIKNAEKYPSGARFIIASNKLIEDTKDPEKLWFYNVDTKEMKKLK